MRVFLYIDMNAFFVNCHRLIDSSLVNQPVVVANQSRRAVISSASYEARAYQIRAGMPLYQARELCPQLIQVGIIRNLYSNYSAKIFHYLVNTFTTACENCSIDEYCLDVTDFYRQYGSAYQCAVTVQSDIWKTFGLPCSIGVSYNKTLAKIASKIRKPSGIFVFSPKNIKTNFWTLPVGSLAGIGEKTALKLSKYHLKTVGALATTQNYALLAKILGKHYQHFINQARGITDNLRTVTIGGRQSVGVDYTLEYDSDNRTFLQNELKILAATVAQRAQALHLAGCVVVCGYKSTKRQWKSKQKLLLSYINQTSEINFYVQRLFHELWKKDLVRGLRVSLQKTTNHNEVYRIIPLELWADC